MTDWTEAEIAEFGPVTIGKDTPPDEVRKRLDNRWAIIRRRDILNGRGWIYDNMPNRVTLAEYNKLGVDPNIRTPFPRR